MSKRILLTSLWLLLTVLTATTAIAEDKELGDMIFSSKIDSMKQAGMGEVIFPHTLHEEQNSCSDCHPDIFIEKRNSNDITMQKNMDGNFCGMCHDSINAFALYECMSCHQEP
ncbi:MAG: hypothetical protein KAR06_09930 [Deltaproteobacteria bacterium]|nr:hypothetical protein [Deltaproteobacteria bacterium]